MHTCMQLVVSKGGDSWKAFVTWIFNWEEWDNVSFEIRTIKSILCSGIQNCYGQISKAYTNIYNKMQSRDIYFAI